MGIDYGHGVTNIDTKTGIRYGIIPQGEICQAWADSSEPYQEYHCPHCGELLDPENPDEYPELPMDCPHCKKELNERDFDFCESDCYIYDSEGYNCQSDSSGDVWVYKSPYYTYCGFCSPCAPGAGYLTTRSDDCKAYCFGHDWFEDNKAPYKVYSVETGLEVKPEGKE